MYTEATKGQITSIKRGVSSAKNNNWGNTVYQALFMSKARTWA